MKQTNLAYRSNRVSYENTKVNERSQRIQRMATFRSTGGVMMKKDKNKLNTVGHARAPKSNTRGTVVAVAVLSAMAFLVLFRGLMITSGYEKLEEKNALLADTISENQKLQFKIEQTLDLKNMEEIAKNTFGMGQPQKSQTVYINLDQTDEVKKVRESGSFFSAVKNFFAGIVEYFA